MPCTSHHVVLVPWWSRCCCRCTLFSPRRIEPALWTGLYPCYMFPLHLHLERPSLRFGKWFWPKVSWTAGSSLNGKFYSSQGPSGTGSWHITRSTIFYKKSYSGLYMSFTHGQSFINKVSVLLCLRSSQKAKPQKKTQKALSLLENNHPCVSVGGPHFENPSASVFASVSSTNTHSK
jgi:hypothetical protein